MLGSLAGAATSKKVAEVYKGKLKQSSLLKSVIAHVYLTVSLIKRAGTKVCYSDPVISCGRIIAQQIKSTLGITG